MANKRKTPRRSTKTASSPKSSKKWFTVVLMYPDYLTDNFGREHYTCSVRATDAKRAIRLAREEVFDANLYEETGEEREDMRNDFFVVQVFNGRPTIPSWGR